ncbi:MAG: AAA family ATPase [Lachnospiraceae bacterium]|nr:AAA family ATPase [Lachnospiraceae bacterium]
MKEIAVYGKGGIGKSTLSANISAALAIRGRKVLQIGCDPKHDSTKLLMGGKKLTTVLDHIRDTSPADYSLKEVLGRGFYDIGCIEAGGPRPGVGCAGRGIITAFEMLDRFHLKDNYDNIVYDVLGDVVCGGFAVPIRSEYADAVFVVTSGEFMSIYAANNILKGIRNYDGGRRRVAGIIYNSRNVAGEDERVERFAEAVELPVIKKIPRDDAFAEAERANRVLMAMEGPDHDGLQKVFLDIADLIISDCSLYEAKPVDEDELEDIILHGGKGGSDKKAEEAFETQVSEELSETYDPGYMSKNVLRREPLHGCAFNGAVCMAVHVRDAVILAHSPRSCAYISYQTISSTMRRRLYERGVPMGSAEIPALASTDMNESDMVFGGLEKLEETVGGILSRKNRPAAVIAVSACPSGIIGDDIEKIRSMSTPEVPVAAIRADGNLTGDYLQGMLMLYTQLALQTVDRNVKPEKNVVNIVFEKVVCRNTESNFRLINGYLERMGVSVNCRFLCNTSYASIRDFCRAELNLLAYKDYTGMILEDFFEKNYGCRFYEDQFPVGFAQTEKWLRGLADHFGRPDAAEEIISENSIIYEKKVRDAREKVEGKSLVIITYNSDIDWILRAALDAGMRILKICKLDFSQDDGFRTQLEEVGSIPLEEDYDRNKRTEDVEALKPDIVLSNYASDETGGGCINDTIPMCPDAGFFTGIDLVIRWGGLLKKGGEEEWKDDRRLFEEYYA